MVLGPIADSDATVTGDRLTPTGSGVLRVRAPWDGNEFRMPDSAIRDFRVVAIPGPSVPLLVSADSPNPTPPFHTWDTAAPTIQAAVDAAAPGETVLITNGVNSIVAHIPNQPP